MSLPNTVSEATRRLNPQLFGRGIALAKKENESIKQPIRQRKGDGMNKWEREFLAVIMALKIESQTVHREVSLPLANGLRYRVDFLVGCRTFDDKSHVFAYEVKGLRRSTGIAKLKMAATLYPWITFYLVTRENGVWQYTKVQP